MYILVIFQSNTKKSFHENSIDNVICQISVILRLTDYSSYQSCSTNMYFLKWKPVFRRMPPVFSFNIRCFRPICIQSPSISNGDNYGDLVTVLVLSLVTLVAMGMVMVTMMRRMNIYLVMVVMLILVILVVVVAVVAVMMTMIFIILRMFQNKHQGQLW